MRTAVIAETGRGLGADYREEASRTSLPAGFGQAGPFASLAELDYPSRMSADAIAYRFCCACSCVCIELSSRAVMTDMDE
jgi:hypothetical protein